MRVAGIVIGVLAVLFVPLSPIVSAELYPTTHAALNGEAVSSSAAAAAPDATPLRRVNVPYFAEGVTFAKTAVFWLGRVTNSDNYADVRMGYSGTELYVRVAVFDRRLWYNSSPTAATLADWDAVSLYLDTKGNTGSAPPAESYRFVGQLTSWETDRARWQTAYRGNGSTWQAASVPFTTVTNWWGDTPANTGDDRGWAVDFRIPLASLGLTAPPKQGTLWGLGVVVHDRDDAEGSAIPAQTWPETFNGSQPATWGQLSFGLPGYAPPAARPGGTVSIRQGLNGAVVPDAAVGGGTSCGSGLDYWTQWGNKTYAGQTAFNVQNQEDMSDWPCFSKYYVTFPLNSVPSGKAILSASFVLHQFGNAGQGWDPGPEPSYIQVLSTNADWQESTLTWNNAPLAEQNLAGAWVDPLDALPASPGVARQWDVSGAVARAYASGQPLRLVVYSADEDYHSGRYFLSSNAEDWDAAGRPTLNINWGDPGTSGGTPTRTPTPSRTPTPAATRTPFPPGFIKNVLRLPLLVKAQQ